MLSYRAFFVGIVVQIFFGGFQAATASPMVDQNFSSTPPSLFSALSLTGDTVFAQSFTVGIGGLLTGADLLAFDGTPFFGAGAPPVSAMIVQIRTLVAGLPTETVLASSTVPASSLPVNPNSQFTHVDFSSGISVVPGQVLALGITGAGVGWSGHVGSQATYSGGQAFVRNHAGDPWQHLPDPGGRESDFLFRTYVDPSQVPEPSTLLLLVSASAILFSKLRYRKPI
jgi:hypothetical protein